MYIGMKNIQQLFNGCATLLKHSDGLHCLTGWNTADQMEGQGFLHTLYVYDYSGISSLRQLPSNLHILCIVPAASDLELIADEADSSCSCLLVASDSASFVYAKLQEYFNDQCAIGFFGQTLLDFLSFEDGLQAAIDHSFQVFGNPIFVFDGGFNLIAASWDEIQRLRLDENIEFIKKRKLSNEDFKLLNRDEHIHKRVQKSEVPVLSYNSELGYEQLLCAIHTQKDMGHIVISAINRPFLPIDRELLLVLKKYICQQLQKDTFIRTNHGFQYEYFLKDLLDGKIASEKSFLEKRMGYVQQEFSGNKCCMVIETAKTPGTLNHIHLRSMVESRFPNSKVMIYNGQIIALLFTLQGQPLPKEYIEITKALCLENELYAGMSNCFANIMDFASYYKQALRAIELGGMVTDKPGLFSYADFYLEHIKSLFLQKESAEVFCHPAMKLLFEYDKAHNSSLAYTLYMFLKHERNLSSAAEERNMHRTSLVYRFQKIKELIGDDFEDYKMRVYLLMSYEMMKEAAMP